MERKKQEAKWQIFKTKRNVERKEKGNLENEKKATKGGSTVMTTNVLRKTGKNNKENSYEWKKVNWKKDFWK